MPDTYIKNRGATKTIFHNNNHNDVTQLNWDADYDGDIANISLDLNQNGIKDHYAIKLTNDDLANILNVPSVSSPLDQRLTNDFNNLQPNPNMYQSVFIPCDDLLSPPQTIPSSINRKEKEKEKEKERVKEKDPNKWYTHISSPLQNEEFVIPIKIDDKTVDNYKFTPKRRHKQMKTHKTYNVYKRPKTEKTRSRTRTRSRTARKTNKQLKYLSKYLTI